MVLVDWLTFTVHGFRLDGVFEALGLDASIFQPCNGRYGYKLGFTYDHMTILIDGSEQMGICVEFSGKGCRAFESNSSVTWQELFDVIVHSPDICHVSRLDVAFDDIAYDGAEGILNLDIIRDDIDDLNFVSKSKQYEVDYGTEGTTCYFGSRKSDILLRIYDKAAEQHLDSVHWVRVEIQLRNKNSIAFLEKVCSTSDVGYTFRSVLYNYLRFIRDNGDINKSRWPIADYWLNLLGKCEKLRLWHSPGTTYSIDNLHSYVIGQAGNAIDTFIDIFGSDGLLEALDNRNKRVSPKYEKLKVEYKKLLKEARNG